MESSTSTHQKNLALSYILWFFLGVFGVHRFYLGRIFSGSIQLGIAILLLVTGYKLAFLVAIILCWWFVDAFLISKYVKAPSFLDKNPLSDDQFRILRRFFLFVCCHESVGEVSYRVCRISMGLENKNDWDLDDFVRDSMKDDLLRRDWNELEFVLEDLKKLAERRRISGRIISCTKEEFNFESVDEFVNLVTDILAEDGYRLWAWDTGMAEYCAFISKIEDTKNIQTLIKALKLKIIG